MSDSPTLDAIVGLAKRRGFVFPTSEIYGGLANSYDYGPLGSLLIKNIRDAWWRVFVESREDMVGLESQILQHPETWVASGHVEALTDPLVEDMVSHKRFRADHVIEAWIDKQGITDVVVEDMDVPSMNAFIADHSIQSPDGNPLTEIKDFNLLFETRLGTVAGEKSLAYLRGETAQGIFVNFKQILDSSRVQLPFGVGQMGTSFRNEITTGQFVFRTLEFQQAEIEYFFDPEVEHWRDLFEEWRQAMLDFCTKELGISSDNLRWRKHSDAERSHYSEDTDDLDYHFPFGWKELWGIAYRTDFDLKQHAQHSGKKLMYTDPHTGKTFYPHVIEPAVGINRLFLMLLSEAYWFDEEHNRTVMKFKPSLAPYKIAVFPLLKNKPELVTKARDVFNTLKTSFTVMWDDRGNIGKRYLYQDEIGTPYCVTIDFDTVEDGSVTVRDRDTTKQERVSIENLNHYFQGKLKL